ncbi:unnamed protein product, partial [Arabidopsis halleri]
LGVTHLALPAGHMLPKMDLSIFGSLQNYHWRPGETLRNLEEFFPCTSTHRIRRILSQFYFPFLDAFTLGALNHQRLFIYQIFCVLKTL